MGNRRNISQPLALGASVLVLALLTGCGGGGGSVASTPTPTPTATPTPTPTPTPSPTPTPTATPAAVFQTAEYNRSSGPAQHNAIAAWQVGATGQGVTIGIIDGGVDATNPEFAGRIHASSADVVSNRGIQPESTHGTQVALFAAAARNNSGIVGIAYDATILALRADSVGSCAGTDGCSFSDTAIANSVDRAISAGAKVINISLGGSSPNLTLRSAIARAATAGLFVVVSAGNRETTDTDADIANPDAFASGLRAAGNGNVVIAGSVDANNTISSFSYRAGSQANWYLGTRGEQICCLYENGVIKTTTGANGETLVFLPRGTSYAAPQIAGAAALLFQAFPNLTGAQVANLLLTTARDAGDAGVDAIYGRGILDIARAFAPQGTLSVASTLAALPATDTTGMTSAAMGDALGQTGAASLSSVMLDSYQRAYTINVGNRLRGAQFNPRLASAIGSNTRHVSAGGDGPVSLSFSVDRSGEAARLPWSGALRLSRADAEAAKVLAGRIVSRLSPSGSIAFGFAQSADGLVAQVQGQREAAFLIAPSPADNFGFYRKGELSIALRRQLGPWGLTLSADKGDVSNGLPDDRLRLEPLGRRKDHTMRFGAALDRRMGALDTSLGATWLSEDRTVLGARLHDAFGHGGADSLFVDAQAGWQVASELRFSAAWRQGFTRARSGGLIAGGSSLESNGWSLDLAKSSVFTGGDTLALRLSQPLRVVGGGLNLDLPVAYDYATLSTTSALRRLTLSPGGREIDAELAWRGSLLGGSASASLFWRKQPGHVAAMPDDKGAAMRWNLEF